MKQQSILAICLILLAVACHIQTMAIWPKTINMLQRNDIVQVDDITPNAICLSYLPYNIWNNPQADYYNWYGLYGKSLSGTTFQTGHVFDRHLAVNGACTLQQKQQNKTVFLNLNELQKAASKIPVVCDIPNRTTFTYDYDGKFASPTDYIEGIDCKSGVKQTFSGYFVEFKRAIKNPKPTHQDYMNSDFVTIWTFYPKRV